MLPLQCLGGSFLKVMDVQNKQLSQQLPVQIRRPVQSHLQHLNLCSEWLFLPSFHPAVNN